MLTVSCGTDGTAARQIEGSLQRKVVGKWSCFVIAKMIKQGFLSKIIMGQRLILGGGMREGMFLLIKWWGYIFLLTTCIRM